MQIGQWFDPEEGRMVVEISTPVVSIFSKARNMSRREAMSEEAPRLLF
jgi:hypothetical protein